MLLSSEGTLSAKLLTQENGYSRLTAQTSSLLYKTDLA